MHVLLLLASSVQAEDTPPGHLLRASSAEASSYLASNWNKYDENYHPNYILDGNPKTAWVEGVPGDGQGEWVEWRVSPIPEVRQVHLRIRNGYQKSTTLMEANAAPVQLDVQLWQGDAKVAETRQTLERAEGWQTIAVPAKGKGLDRVRLVVVDAVSGSRYKDLCISDAELWVDASLEYDAVFENAKHAALEKWVGDRVKQAAYFASLPPEYPFASTRFANTGGQPKFMDPRVKEAIAKVEAHQASVEDLKASTPTWRMDLKHALVEPDGFLWSWRWIDEAMRWVAPERTLFESVEAWHTVGTDRIGPIHLDGTANQPKRATFEIRTDDFSYGRGYGGTHGRWALTFDDAGRLDVASFQGEDLSDMGDPPEASRMWVDVRWSESGKIDRVEIAQANGASTYYLQLEPTE